MSEKTATAPEKKDTLTLEKFVSAYLEYHGLWGDPYWDAIRNAYLVPNPKAEDRERIAYFDHPASVNDVVNMIKSASKDPAQAAEAFKIVDLVRKAYSPDGKMHIDLFINRAMRFKDPQITYNALKYLKKQGYIKQCDTATQESVVYALANSKYADISDIYDVLFYCKTIDQARQVVNAVFDKADKDLSAEMNKEIPELDQIRYLIFYPKRCTEILYINSYHRDLSQELQAQLENMTNFNHQELKSYYDAANDKYDEKKIFISGDSEFTKHYDDAVILQMADVRHQNENLQHENQELKRTTATFPSQIAELQGKIKVLTEKLEQENAQRVSAERTIKMLKSHINMLIAAAENVRGGLGGRGVKELQAVIQDVNTQER